MKTGRVKIDPQFSVYFQNIPENLFLTSMVGQVLINLVRKRKYNKRSVVLMTLRS